MLAEAGAVGDGGAGPSRVSRAATRPPPDSTQTPTAPQGLVGRDFSADRPGVKLVGDITYIPA